MENSALMSPIPIATIIACYFLTLKIGPVLMKNRQPFNLKNVLVYYNYSQIFFNLYVLFAMYPVAYKITVFCATEFSNPEELPLMAYLHYKYLLLKLYDLLDTVFFVLRKKQAQISFLHVYHHVLVFLVSWIMIKYFPPPQYPVGPLGLFATANCFVHAVMYTYYLKSAKGRVKNVSWKKYVTILQIVQHFLMLFATSYAFVDAENCPFPRSLVLVGVGGFGSMVYLFSQFYYHAYLRKKVTPKVE